MTERAVIHVITGLHKGGAEGVLYRLCEATLRDRSRIVVVSLTGRGTYGAALEEMGVAVVALDFSTLIGVISGIGRLWRIVRRMKPVIVQTWMYHGDFIGGLVARMAGERRIVWNIRHSNLDPAHDRASTRAIVRLCALLSSLVPTAIVSCSAVASELHQKLGFDAAKFVNIPNGYDTQKYYPDATVGRVIRDELGLSSDEFVIGMVGRLHPQKDHDNLFEALSILAERGRKFRCVLVGRGLDNSNELLVAKLRSMNLVHLVELASARDDVHSLMNALSIHVLSSSAGEGFPNVVAEAMACGVPCVVTDVGDAATIVAHTGWIIPPKDSAALADAIEGAMREAQAPTVWSRRRASCRQRVCENFSLQRMTDSYLSTWSALG